MVPIKKQSTTYNNYVCGMKWPSQFLSYGIGVACKALFFSGLSSKAIWSATFRPTAFYSLTLLHPSASLGIDGEHSLAAPPHEQDG